MILAPFDDEERQVAYTPNDAAYGHSPAAPAYAPPGYAPTPAVTYASWGRRVGATLVDLAAVLPVYIVALAFLDTLAVYGLLLLAGVALHGYNRWFLAGRTGRSWGKQALGIRLTGERTRMPVGAGLAFGRDLAHFADGAIFSIGYLIPLWDRKRQTLADKIVSTVVVH